jgi:hypothetical protein
MTNQDDESDRESIEAKFCRQNSSRRIPLRIELPPPPSSVSSLTWRDHIDKEPWDKDKENGASYVKKSAVRLGSVVKLLKEAESFRVGTRKPLGDASNGRIKLESRAASDRELKKVQSKLSEFC